MLTPGSFGSTMMRGGWRCQIHRLQAVKRELPISLMTYSLAHPHFTAESVMKEQNPSVIRSHISLTRLELPMACH